MERNALARNSDRAERETREVNENLISGGKLTDAVIDTIGALVVVLDRDARIILFNKGCELVTGYTFDEVKDRRIWDLFIVRDEVETVKSVFRGLLSGDFPNTHTNVWATKASGRRLIEWSNTALCDGTGKVTHVVATGIDITEQTAHREDSERNEERLRSILHTVPDAIITIDETGIVESYSRSAERIFGYTAEEVVGRNVNMLMPTPYTENHDRYIERYLRTGEKRIIGIGRIVTGLRKNGSTFPMELQVGEMSLAGGKHFTGFIHDITERQHAEGRMRMQDLQAELLHVSRSSTMGEMASGLAHELNQPLTAIMNYVQTCRRLMCRGNGKDSDKVHEIMDKALDQAMRASEIIRGIRSFLEKGEVARTHSDINKLVEEASALALAGVADKMIKVSMVLSPKLPEVYVNDTQIQQLVVNLIRNSIDAMEGCEVRKLAIRTFLTEDGSVCVAVRDTGIGLSDEIKARLFQPFVTTKASGTGIGLAISRTIIDAHGGRLWASDNADGGASFQFTLTVDGETEDD